MDDRSLSPCRIGTVALRLAVLCALLLSIVVWPDPAAAQTPAAAAQELADRYVPVVYLRKQEKDCAVPPEGGEPYVPAPVEIVFNNPEVKLRQATGGAPASDPVLLGNPQAIDLAKQADDTYLDFPGNSRAPGCTYERDSRREMAALNAVPTTYAHIVEYPEDNHLVIQYWLYYYFNHWNNLHESDWEMVQVIWDNAGTIEQALQTPPDRTGYAQHEGGETADWGDDKLGLEDGTHPLVYPAAGSHASFYGQNVYIGWGENGTGFGCDDSTAPSVRTPVKAVVVPHDPDPNGEFAWLLYPGRWGQRQPSFFNGPRGPMFGPKWADPWEKAEEWRDTSLVVPGSRALGPNATDLFCELTSFSSDVLGFLDEHPWITAGGFGAGLVAFAFFAKMAWPTFLAAKSVYLSNWRVFAGIGLLAIPIGWLFNLIQVLATARGPLGWAVDWFDNTAGADLWAVSLLGGIQGAVTTLAIVPAVIQAIVDIQRGNKPGIVRSYRFAFLELKRLATAAGMFLVAIGGLAIVIFGLPLAIYYSIRWQFFGQALLLDHAETGRAALRESSRSVKGHWWRTLATSVAFHALVVVACPLAGVILFVFGKAAIGLANGISSFIYAVTIPLLGIALTLLYQRQRDEEPLIRQEQVLVPSADC